MYRRDGSGVVHADNDMAFKFIKLERDFTNQINTLENRILQLENKLNGTDHNPQTISTILS